MSDKCVMRKVVSAEDKWFITANDPETRMVSQTNYHECMLDCGHCEYRRVQGGGDPKWLACAACTGRDLSASERKRRGP